ncbi:hypothetical protein CONLIGDRAFT_483748 [Coniochaeta ligniaria NRRL 30616]|uniref:Uncharacterized protein n=1 Tax=Coniochaeta ligniaria NRRL 30616 TaxID=1408157 RepID=A0A1J7JGH7_9PEZI|nr:hypothetical protein CONLIGDRAFT_483748 [Coniochaeta ligniaria NRRL 30616]
MPLAASLAFHSCRLRRASVFHPEGSTSSSKPLRCSLSLPLSARKISAPSSLSSPRLRVASLHSRISSRQSIQLTEPDIIRSMAVYWLLWYLSGGSRLKNWRTSCTPTQAFGALEIYAQSIQSAQSDHRMQASCQPLNVRLLAIGSEVPVPSETNNGFLVLAPALRCKDRS